MKITRKTNETDILLESSEVTRINTGVPMFDHFMSQFFKGLGTPFTLIIQGDLEIDAHHSLEDAGYVIGRLIKMQYEEEQVMRYGSLIQLMDDAALEMAIDLSGRSTLVLCDFDDMMLSYGGLAWDDLREFLHAMVREGAMTLHVRKLRGESAHHICEALFKGLGRLLAQALSPANQPLSTKGRVSWEVTP